MRSARSIAIAVVAATFAAAIASPAAAQQRLGNAWTRFFLQPSVALAQLEEIQADLKLTDEQKSLVAKLNERLNADRMQLFQDSGGDRQKIREGMNKLYAEVADDFNEELEEPQQKRIREIYLQVNGPVAFQDDAVAKALKLDDEQRKKLDEARDASREEFMNAGLQDLEPEAREKRVEEMIKSRDERLTAALTDEQRAEFEKMKGEKLEVDLSKMPVPGR